MLRIQREPIHKNKLFISSMAICAGFLITIAGVRTFVNGDMSTQQSVQSEQASEQSSLIPVDESKDDGQRTSGQDEQSASEPQSDAKGTVQKEQATSSDSSGSNWSEQPATQDSSPASGTTAPSSPSEDSTPQQGEGTGAGSDAQPEDQPETSTPPSEDDAKDCLELIGMELLCDTSSTVPIVVPWLVSPEQSPIMNILP